MLINCDKSAIFLVDVQQKLLQHIHQADEIEERCAWLLNIAQLLFIPSLISEQYPKGLGPTTEKLKNCALMSATIEKTQFSFAHEHAFKSFTQQHQTEHAILIGIEAHVCVLQSALDLIEQGLTVFVVADAVGSRNAYDKKIALKRMQNIGVHIVSAEMVVFEWLRCSGTAQFKTISQNYLKV